LLYGQFGKERVEAELNEFLSYDFQPRVGGGIGMTRMIRAVEEYKKITPPSIKRGRATTYRVGSKNFKRSFSNMHGIEQ